MITKEEINRITIKKGIKDMTVIEKDYALIWALKCIYSNPKLFNTLNFKGGTCISKVYVNDYRFSEDIDFTISKEFPMAKETLENEMNKSLETSQKQDGPVLQLLAEEGYSNPGLISYKVRYIGPLNFPAFIKLEISVREPMIYPPVIKTIQKTLYQDLNDFKLNCYDFKEILIEKVRAIMQRSKARDYYDVWQLLKQKEFKNNIAADYIRTKVKEKCDLKNIPYEPELMFDDANLNKTSQFWGQSLERLMQTVPPFQTVISELVKEYFFAESSLFDYSASFNIELLDDINRNDSTGLLIKRAYQLASQKYDDKLNSKTKKEVFFGLLKLDELYRKSYAQKTPESLMHQLINLQNDRDQEIKQFAEMLFNYLAQKNLFPKNSKK